MTVKHNEHKHVANAVGSHDSLQHHLQRKLRPSPSQRRQAAEQPSEKAIEEDIKNYNYRRIPLRLGVEHQQLGQHQQHNASAPNRRIYFIGSKVHFLLLVSIY